MRTQDTPLRELSSAQAEDTQSRDPSQRIGEMPVFRIREDFPILNRTIRGRELVYLDNAATSQKPLAVLRAVENYYRHSNANVHRALHTLGEEATAGYENGRESIRRFIGAASTREIVFTRGATEAINLVSFSWGRKNLKDGDEILLTEMEHHSNLVPWQLLATEKNCRLRFIPFGKDGVLELDDLGKIWNDRIRLVAMTHVSNVFGTVNDVRRVIDFAHERGVPVLLDGAQSVPHMPVDVQALDCDFMVFSGHKMCSPMGIGVLYGRESLLEEMPPFQGGGDMIRSVWLEKAEWNEIPWKFEAGTPNVEGAVGLSAAVTYLSGLGMENVRDHEGRLTGYALDRLREVPGLTVYGPDYTPDVTQPTRSGVISFNLDGVHPHDAAQYLDREAIAVRAGHHCAHPLMRKLGIAATVRASFYLYNTRREIDRLAETLVQAREFFSDGL